MYITGHWQWLLLVHPKLEKGDIYQWSSLLNLWKSDEKNSEHRGNIPKLIIPKLLFYPQKLECMHM